MYKRIRLFSCPLLLSILFLIRKPMRKQIKYSIVNVHVYKNKITFNTLELIVSYYPEKESYANKEL